MTSPFSQQLLARLDSHDRALFVRFALHSRPASARRPAWRALTHVGGARVSIALTLLLLPLKGQPAFVKAALSLVLSHWIVCVIKKNAGRVRPSVSMAFDAFDTVPDCFSFPSGHSAAAMAVALSYAVAFPWLIAPALALALLVGVSRVMLGVHYPGDVIAGQAVAIAVAIAVALAAVAIR